MCVAEERNDTCTETCSVQELRYERGITNGMGSVPTSMESVNVRRGVEGQDIKRT